MPSRQINEFITKRKQKKIELVARPVDGAQVVVGEVDGVELVELRKSLLWNVLNPIVTHIQNLDPSLVCHGHLVLGQVMLTIQCGLQL